MALTRPGQEAAEAEGSADTGSGKAADGAELGGGEWAEPVHGAAADQPEWR